MLLGVQNRTEAEAVSVEGRLRGRQMLAVAEAVPHPEYRVTRRYHDIALLRLVKSVATHSYGVRPACLHTDLDGDLTGRQAVATGWGATGFGETPISRHIVNWKINA